VFTFNVGESGVAVVTIAMSDLPVNVWNERSIRAFAETLEEVLATPGLRGIVLRSGRETFLAGADLKSMWPLGDLGKNMALVRDLSTALRRLETCGVPVAAAIDGSALGGGYELCLACHRRLAKADDAIRIGLPEARLNLAQAVIHLATAPKSNAVILAIDEALADVRSGVGGSVPRHLRDSHYPGSRGLGHGAAAGPRYAAQAGTGWGRSRRGDGVHVAVGSAAAAADRGGCRLAGVGPTTAVPDGRRPVR